MLILGVSAFYHDSAAALLRDGRIVSAAQEERFTRKKHDSSFPSNAITFCLKNSSLSIDDIDYVAFYEEPSLKFDRLLKTYLAIAPRGFESFMQAMPAWISGKLFQERIICEGFRSVAGKTLSKNKLLFSRHHESHASSAFYPSPFNKACILTADGVGEWATTSVSVGCSNKIDTLKELNFPHSLGLLYSAFTYQVGFKVNSGEYKVMGLAPYGVPRFTQKILDHLIDLKDDGSFRLDMQYFDYCGGLKMTSSAFDDLFGEKPRQQESPLKQVHMDLAASIQAVTEEVMLRLVRSSRKETGLNSLCLAGGVALNCVANGKILRDNAFKEVWVQPASGDAGGAIGAALSIYHKKLGHPRKKLVSQDDMTGGFLGPGFSNDEIEKCLQEEGAQFEKVEFQKIVKITAEALIQGNAVAWFQGRMEFGPRALGARSILADPRSPATQERLNVKVKNREDFRPFAPAVLAEDVSNWFEFAGSSPYMSFVADVHKNQRNKTMKEDSAAIGLEKLKVVRSTIPAVTHVDYSARLQTVHEDNSPKFHALLKEFRSRTGCPVLVNTSFNIRGEPVVCNPYDAFRCFMSTDLDYLIIGDFVLKKTDQLPGTNGRYGNNPELD